MQEYKRIDIGKDQIVPVAERMRKEGRYLVTVSYTHLRAHET